MARDKGKSAAPAPLLFVMNRLVLFGALLVLVGFVTLALSDYAFASLAVDASLPAAVTNQRYLTISIVYAIGEVLIGVGFFLALYGFARQVARQA